MAYRCRNNPEIELGEVRIAQRIIEAQGIKFGGFLEWITPEDTAPGRTEENNTSDSNDSEADPDDGEETERTPQSPSSE